MNIIGNRKLFAAILVLIVTALPVAAQNRRGGSAQPGTPIITTPPQTETVSGLVSSIDFQYGEGYPNFVLSAAGMNYVIYVGPLWYLDNNDFELQVNDKVEAVIFRDRLSNDVWVASVLTNLTSTQQLVLRDASGLPLWLRHGTGQHAGFGSGNTENMPGQFASVRQGQGRAALRAGQASIDLSTLQLYKGTVIKVNLEAGTTHPTIEVALGSGAAVFCLAPYRFLDQIGLATKIGDSVEIVAADCAQDINEYVVFSITVNDKSFVLRNTDGTPLWYFGRRN